MGLLMFKGMRFALCAVVLCAAFMSHPIVAAEPTEQAVERAANAGDFVLAYETLVKLAESGNAKAQGFLAFVLYEGEWGVAVDEMKAKAWMEKAYAQNDAYAHLFVAQTNDPNAPEENATDPSLIKTHDWKSNIVVAAENGHPYAQNRMGQWAKEKYKYKEAIEWYRKASEKGGDYYAVNYFVTMSLYQWPRRVRVEEIEKRISSGNPLGFEALHAAYTFALQAPRDYRKASEYGAIGRFYGAELSSEASKRINEKLSEDEQAVLSEQALERLGTWMRDPEMLIGLSTSWCLEQGYLFPVCLHRAVEDHLFCAADYILWNFDNFPDFPAYKACRKSFFESSSETN